MPDVVGPFKLASSSISPIQAHVAHLRHLSTPDTAQRLLRDRFGMQAREARTEGRLVSSHIEQALAFHAHSMAASPRIRPVLQYYCYLNLAVALILSYRPANYQQYRKHGVEDQSHRLRNLELSSILVKVRKGAVPVFHSILSAEPIVGRHFRLNELAGSIPLVKYELSNLFGMRCQTIIVRDIVANDASGKWWSEMSFECIDVEGQPANLTKSRLERAVPELRQFFTIIGQRKDRLQYRSRNSWPNQAAAQAWHSQNSLKAVNYGGHRIYMGPGLQFDLQNEYQWHGLTGKPLLPTLTATLLLAFALASIARYRPSIARGVEGISLSVLLDIFIAEADSIVIPSMRNLLYREEVCIQLLDAI